MSNELAVASTTRTNTVGFYNAKTWPVHLIISELNLTLQLAPGEFIKDKAGRKINDPFFERYQKQLSREVSDTEVPVIRIPAPKLRAVVDDGHSVREVTQFTTGERGQRVPVVPEPRPRAEVAINASPIRGMSMAEARRLKLVKPTRVVPEDYGAPETDGTPGHGGGIPEIKYATDTQRTKIAPLPKPEITDVRGEAIAVAPEQKALAENLGQAVNTVKATGADDLVSKPVPKARVPQAGLPVAQVESPADAEAIFGNTVVESAVPVLDITSAKLLEVPEAPAVEIELEIAAPAPAAPPAPVKAKARFACPHCEQSFFFESKLTKHLAQAHA